MITSTPTLWSSYLAFLEVGIALAGWENVGEGAEEATVDQLRRGESCNGKLEVLPAKLGFASGCFDIGVGIGEFYRCQL